MSDGQRAVSRMPEDVWRAARAIFDELLSVQKTVNTTSTWQLSIRLANASLLAARPTILEWVGNRDLYTDQDRFDYDDEGWQ